MKRKTKWITSFALVALMAASTAQAFSFANAEMLENGSNVSPDGLFEATSGFTVQANTDVPDYMKYGTFYDSKTATYQTVDENSEEDYLEDWETNGVLLTSTAANKKIYYSNVLDISSFTTKDDFLVFAPINSVRGSADFTAMTITLEDADDETNYVQIDLLVNPWWGKNTMIGISTPNFSSRGYRWGDWIGGDVGTWCSDKIAISFSGYSDEDGNATTSDEANRFRAFKLHYDTEEMLFSATIHRGQVIPILKLNDGHSVGYGKEWGGFKKNRVKLSVSMSSFTSSSASVMMLNVFGQGLNGETVNDTTAPSMTFDETASQTPMAKVGKAYPVYGCSADDVVSGECSVEKTLTAPSGEKTTLTGDSFVPTQSGYYTLTYRASDSAGNAAEKSFRILAKNAIAALTIEAEGAGEAYAVGSRIPVGEAALSGGAGVLSCEVEVRRVGGTEILPITDGAFVPMLAGDYYVVYTARDYIGNVVTKTLSYSVAANPSPVADPLQKLQRLYDGVTVEMPVPTAYDYATALGSRLSATYTLTAQSEDGSYSEMVEGGKFTPSKEKFGDSVTFVYVISSVGDSTKQEIVSYSVDLMEVPKQLDGYFVYDENEFIVTRNSKEESGYLRFTTKEGVTGDRSFSFANPIGARMFEVAFAIPAKEQNFQTFTVKLRDSANASIGFDMQLRAMTSGSDKTRCTYVRSGGVDYAMKGVFNSLDSAGGEASSATPMLLKYSNGSILDYSGDTVFTPTANYDGKTFDGFPSGKVYVSFEFEGVEGTSGITLTALSTQTMYAEYHRTTGELLPFKDEIRSTILLDKDVPDTFKIGQTVEIPYACAYDVLSPCVDVKVSLRTPNGTYLYKEVLSEKGMSFKLDSYGRYTLTYEAKDGSGKTTLLSYTIRATDTLAPDVVVLSKSQVTVKVGEALTIPKAVVTDDRDIEPRLFVMIVKPDATLLTLGEYDFESGKVLTYETDSNDQRVAVTKYTFSQKGTYSIRYYALDSEYNVTIVDVSVRVK